MNVLLVGTSIRVSRVDPCFFLSDLPKEVNSVLLLPLVETSKVKGLALF